MSEKREWRECLAQCQIAYNSTDHESTGYAPFELVFGRTPRIPTGTHTINDPPTYAEYVKDLIETLNQTQTIAAITMAQATYGSKYYYDRKLNVKNFREGEMIKLLKEPRKGKFDAQYTGPFEIIGIDQENHTAEVIRGDKIKKVHLDKIERLYPTVERDRVNKKQTGEK